MDRNFHAEQNTAAELAGRSNTDAVSGPHRPKYFRRPMLAAAEVHVRQVRCRCHARQPSAARLARTMLWRRLKCGRHPAHEVCLVRPSQAPATLPPLPTQQDLNATAPAALYRGGPAADEAKSKTVGTQSDYRENEAQTVPWEPGYVIPAPSVKQVRQMDTAQ